MNKVVLITGASRGIGASIATKMASLHYNIVLNYVQSKNKAEKLQEELETKYQVQVLLVQADVSKEIEVKKMLELTMQTFGQIDCIVNNAGIAMDTLVEDKNVTDFQRILDVNTIGPFLVAKEGAKYMKKGSIINIASTNGIDTYYPYSLDYDASKSALISLTHNLAVHYAPNIRVNAIAPGWIDTDMNKNLDAEFRRKEQDRILLQRFGTPLEVANVVAFLASEEASFINNTIIRVDGGKL